MLRHANTGPPSAGEEDPRAGLGIGRWIARVALALWMPTVCLGIGSLMVGHWAPLPAPSTSEGAALTVGLRDLIMEGGPSTNRRTQAADGWKLVHVLYEDCRCSQAVMEYLLEPKRQAPADEWVLLVDGNSDGDFHGDLVSRGFRTHRLSAEALLSGFGIEAAPLFIVLNGANEVRFVGGYAARKESLSYQDVFTLEALQAGSTPPSLPVLGCGVSSSLQSMLDPLNLKY